MENFDIQIPSKLKLFDIVSVQPYKGSPEYNQRLKAFQSEVNSKKTVKRIINIIFWLALIGLLVYLRIQGMKN